VRTTLWMAVVVVMTFSNVSKASTAWDISMANDIPGKGGWLTCLPFAKELHNRLVSNGIESHLVTLKWVDGSRPHIVVVYRDTDGRYYGMDNRERKPRWLSGNSPEEWVFSWYGGAVARVYRHVEGRSFSVVAQNR